MSPSRVVPASVSSTWLPELANRRIVHVLVALGLAGALTELASGVFIPRLLLYVAVLAFGALGLVRCRRTDRRAAAAR